jgi:epoxyqueuosine reductase
LAGGAQLPELTSADVKTRALELGFDQCGIAPVGPFPELAFLDEWLRRGYGGTMTYLNRSARKRRNACAAEPTARSVVVTATIYNTNRPYSIETRDPLRAVISRYAWGDDYHGIVRQRLDALVEWMRGMVSKPFTARVYVDTGPIQERVYAQYAGLGWIGKNSCLINPELGSWVFLGCLICSLPLEPDEPGLDQCGECTACLSACPTRAIVEPRVLDATRCISFLTIEQRRAIPEPLRPSLRNLVYGCDVCQDVCPWNRRAAVSESPEWAPRAAFDSPEALTLWRMSDVALTSLLEGSPMTRAGVTKLRRNLAVVLGNATGVVSPEEIDGDDDPGRPSIREPLVAQHVAWARAQLRGDEGGSIAADGTV